MCIFFSGIGKDGVILSQLYGYTPVCFKEKICKCGAPVGVVDKLVKKIAKDKRALVIYDYDKNKTEKNKRIIYLNNIDTEMNLQRIYLRIMYKSHWIDEKKFNVPMEMLYELGKIVGGLIKHYGKNNTK